MKPSNIFIVALTAFSAAVLAGCSKTDSDDSAAKAPDKAEAKSGPGVTLDTETQERIGLKIETPEPAQWQPGIHATGRVADPLAFVAAATDYETARAAASASQAELDRTQKLASQENASPRALEGAQATASRDALALKAARAKFTADWGAQLADQTNLTAFAQRLQSEDMSFVKLLLPVGTFPDPLPQTATIYIFGTETNAVVGEFADNLFIDPGAQAQTLLFRVKQKLSPNVSVEAQLNLPGEPVNGVIVPAGAVLRYEGRGWVYVQTETNQFVRAEVPLDRLTKDGWFVSENLSATNRIVVTGAQTVLSTELSSGGFSTGQRD